MGEDAGGAVGELWGSCGEAVGGAVGELWEGHISRPLP